MLLPAGWYVVAAANELKGQKPLAIKRFAQDIVLWREKSGKAVAMIDRCPHRSAQLSCGAVRDNVIECGFHGFQFDAGTYAQTLATYGDSILTIIFASLVAIFTVAVFRFV